jgi:hypothetical protein
MASTMSFKQPPTQPDPSPADLPPSPTGGQVEEEWGRTALPASSEGDSGAPDEAVAAEAQPAKGNRLAPLSLVVSGRGGRPASYVLVLLLTALLLVGAVVGFNAYVDPYGTVGTGALPPVTWTDRSLKVNLVEHLRVAPGVVVLGSSRAMKVQPSFITSRTRLTAFNAAVSSGRPVDAWAFTNFIHARFPAAHSRYLWLLDIEAFRQWPVDPGLLNTPQLAGFLSVGTRIGTRFGQLPLLFSWQTFWKSLQSVRHSAHQPAAALRTSIGGTQFAPDGFRVLDYHDRNLAKGLSLAKELPATIRQGVATYRGDYSRLDPTAESYFQRTLSFMNGLGATPVIVLTPMQPEMLARVASLGYDARYHDVLAYLRSLQGRYRFVLLDFTHLASFGGRAADFYDGYHMTVANTQRLVNAVLAKAPGALR